MTSSMPVASEYRLSARGNKLDNVVTSGKSQRGRSQSTILSDKGTKLSENRFSENFLEKSLGKSGLSDQALEHIGLALLRKRSASGGGNIRACCDPIFTHPETGASIYCGGWSAADNLDALGSRNIRRVVNCQDRSSENFFAKQKIVQTAEGWEKLASVSGSIGKTSGGYRTSGGSYTSGPSGRSANSTHSTLSFGKHTSEVSRLLFDGNHLSSSIGTDDAKGPDDANLPSSSALKQRNDTDGTLGNANALDEPGLKQADAAAEDDRMNALQRGNDAPFEILYHRFHINGLDGSASSLHFGSRLMADRDSSEKKERERKVVEQFECFWKFLDDGLEKGESGLIHCAAGMHRAGGASVSYLMWKHNLNYEKALKLAQSKRSVINPYHRNSLKLVEKVLGV